MNPTNTVGFGVGETGAFSEKVGIPNDTPIWQHKEGRDGFISSHSFQIVDGQVLYWPGTGTLNLMDISSGSEREICNWPAGKIPFRPQICLSNNKILAGSLMLNAESFDRLAKFSELDHDHASRLNEQVAAPVHNGFLYLGGNRARGSGVGKPLPPLVSRPLYHICSDSLKIRKIADDVTAFVMLSHNDFYFALREGRLVCTHWESGERLWERDVKLSWHASVDKKKKLGRHDMPNVQLMLTDEFLYLYRDSAFLNQYDIKSGELVGQVDTTLSNWRSQEGSRFQGTQHYIADGILYIIFNYWRVSKTIAVSIATGKEVFHLSTDQSEEFGLCIAGDLLFYTDKRHGTLLARDRFTGEIVWEVACPVSYLYIGQPIDNKILFYSTNGVKACFQWDEPYVSSQKVQKVSGQKVSGHPS